MNPDATETREAGTPAAPIVIHRSPDAPLRISFPKPEEGHPLREVREAAGRARLWDGALSEASAAYEAGDYSRVMAHLGGDDGARHRFAGAGYVSIEYEGTPPPPSQVDAYLRLATVEYQVGDALRDVRDTEYRWLRDQAAKGKLKRTEQDGVYEIVGKNVDLFGLVAAIKGSGEIVDVKVVVDGHGTRTSKRCTGSCQNARTSDCKCSCGGRGHGISPAAGWRVTSSTETPDPENPDRLRFCREYLVTGDPG